MTLRVDQREPRPCSLSGRCAQENGEHAQSVATLQVDNPSAPGGQTTVYVLGISHVSKKSAEDIRELIRAVRPEVPWAPVTTHDIENDCRRLLATGLFGSVRPLLRPPTNACAPQYIQGQDGNLVFSIPAGSIRFFTTPRTGLPKATGFTARVDSSLGGGTLPEEEVQRIGDELVKACTDGTSLVTACLQARPALEQLAKGHLSSSAGGQMQVAFRGLQTGEVEAVIKAALPDSERPKYESGFEGSAVGGEGPGIQRFQAQRGSVELSPKMTIENIAAIMPVASDSIDDILSERPHRHESAASSSSRMGQKDESSEMTRWRHWSADEFKAEEEAEDEDDEEVKPDWKEQVTEKFGEWLTTTYSTFQSKAGETVGLEPGEAWREAVQSASDFGAAQVHFGDMPASLSGPRLAKGVLVGMATRLGAAIALSVGLGFGSATHQLPEDPGWAVPLAIAAAWGYFAWALGGPFLEVWLFSRGDAQQIEDAVAVREALQGGGGGMYRLRGEDAIIGFPGADKSVIRERDVYMARTLRAAAQGFSGSPALVQQPGNSSPDGRQTWRYLMPDAAEARDSPLQRSAPYLGGEGVYEPLQGVSKVVGVVGTAHVRGIIENWEAAESAEGVTRLLGNE
ncbi:hypothetical protein WJX73_006178 [Symbiochloris irregularis]|uniref:Uncharacterized protein n=1 Tax=Symbiochloris irregularis TaxID=706552 RepID=A0AAW1NQY2_9CHLO